MIATIMNTYSKHLVFKSFSISLFVWLTMVCLDFSVSLVMELENLSETDSFLSLFLALLTEQPHKCLQYLESSMLIGTLIALTLFNQQGNLVFLRSLGFSPSKIVLIASTGPLLLSFLVTALDEFVFIPLVTDQVISQTNSLAEERLNKDSYSWQLSNENLIGVQNLSSNKIKDVQVVEFNEVGDVIRAEKFNSGLLKDNKLTLRLTEGRSSQTEILPFLLKAPLNTKSLESMSLRSLLKMQKNYSSLKVSNDLRLIKAAVYSKIFLPAFVLGIIFFAGSLMFSLVRSGGIGRQIVFGIFFGLLFDLTKDLLVASFLTYQWPILVAYLLPIFFLIMAGWIGYRRI